VSLSLNRLDYLQLQMIEAALDRLSSNDYGICLGCEEPIPAKRLKALPWARYCVGCQESIGAATEDQDARGLPRTTVGLAD
jgi:DnaK suppressor protein